MIVFFLPSAFGDCFMNSNQSHRMTKKIALSSGLGTIYLINTILAILAAISAPSRKQSSLLWGAKTFAVGGIAYDQLMQIPTPEELAERARKDEEEMAMRGSRGRNRRERRQKS